MQENSGPVLGFLTPQEYVRTHPITLELTKRGVTADQLAAMRFRAKDQAKSFDQRAVVWANGMPIEAMPFVRAYCALKWLILEDPPASRDKDDAWRYASAAMMAPVVAMGLRHQEAQSRRAKRPRGKVTDDGQTIRQIIETLVHNPEHCGKTAGELWPPLFALLDEHDLEPKEIPHSDRRKRRYEYLIGDKRKKLSYGQFANLIGEIRSGKSV